MSIQAIPDKKTGYSMQPIGSIEQDLNTRRLNTRERVFLGATILLMLGSALMLFTNRSYFENWHLVMIGMPFGRGVLLVSLSLLAFKVSFLVFMATLYRKYKALPSVSDEELPHCTIIVPAFNEGEGVWHTLISICESDYPTHKMQVIAFDDGSSDDTWEWMLQAKRKLGTRISIFQQPRNMGKRQALYRGFNLATGDVFVTIDSDSIISKSTLRNLVSPFVIDENCGAVAGNVRVLNRQKALIPRMLNASFTFSFEFIRSAQSQLGSVLCTPGALSAYRRTAVIKALPDWINQTFMGKKSDIGEDRAMTNMILKQGKHVLFQRNAPVFTLAPEKFRNLHKMFTRWERSNIRENIMMSKFAFGNFRDANKTGARILLLNQWLRVILACPLLIVTLVLLALNPITFFVSAFVGMFVFSLIQYVVNVRRHSALDSVWLFPYSVFFAFSLFWVTPYAILTANRSGWLTR